MLNILNLMCFEKGQWTEKVTVLSRIISSPDTTTLLTQHSYFISKFKKALAQVQYFKDNTTQTWENNIEYLILLTGQLQQIPKSGKFATPIEIKQL